MKRVFTAAACAILVSCGGDDRVAGSGSFVGNGIASGRILSPSGKPATGVRVDCLPDSVLPWESRPANWTASTDTVGAWTCTDLPLRRISIEAFDPVSGLTFWRQDTLSSSRTDKASTDTLAPSGRLVVEIQSGFGGIFSLTGLSRTISFEGPGDFRFEGVPAGWTGSLVVHPSGGGSLALVQNLSVHPGGSDTARIGSLALVRAPLGTTALSGTSGFPLLLRLDSNWTGFSTAAGDGRDLRIFDRTGRRIPTTIARWDAGRKEAAIWALVDSIAPGATSVDLALHWGDTASAKNNGVFAIATGWEAAWPLGDTGSTIADRTGSHPASSTALSTANGVVGAASSFDGSKSFVVVPGAATGPLALAEKGPWTLSCWVRLSEFKTSRFVAGRGEHGSHIKFQADFAADSNLWLASDYRDEPPGGRVVLAKADTARWTHLAATVSGDIVVLYVDGIPTTTAPRYNQQDMGRWNAPFAIGASVDTAGIPDKLFRGDIAEVWVQSVARSAEWIRLSAINQRPEAPKAILLR